MRDRQSYVCIYIYKYLGVWMVEMGGCICVYICRAAFAGKGVEMR